MAKITTLSQLKVMLWRRKYMRAYMKNYKKRNKEVKDGKEGE